MGRPASAVAVLDDNGARTMHQPDKIKRRPDGSIDSAHYLALGRTCRSRMVRRNGGAMLRRTAAMLRLRAWRPDDQRYTPASSTHRAVRHPG